MFIYISIYARYSEDRLKNKFDNVETTKKFFFLML